MKINRDFPLEQLTKLGYGIEFVPSIHPNRLTVVMKDREVFRCDIRNLLFNMFYADDVVAKRLVAAVQEARRRFYDEDNVPVFESVKEGMRLLQMQREAGSLGQLLKSNTEVIYEIPLHLARGGGAHRGKGAKAVSEEKVPQVQEVEEELGKAKEQANNGSNSDNNNVEEDVVAGG